MATVTGLTAEAMQEIANGTIVSARIEENDLILTTRAAVDINVGKVMFTDEDIAALIADPNTDTSITIGDFLTSRTTTQVPPLVAAAIAADPTVAQAAANAVTADIAGRDLLESKDTYAPEVVFSITDSLKRRSWLEIAKDGGLTVHAAQMVAEAVGPLVQSDLQEVSDTGYAFALVDEENRISFAIRYDGRAQFFKPLVSRFVAWGDSITFGGWATRLASLLGTQVIPQGVSGERAIPIATRQGGIRRLMTISGGQIPESGSVVVTGDGTLVEPNGSQNAGTQNGYLAGVHGTLIAGSDINHLQFVRSSSGSVVSVPNPVPWITDSSHLYRDFINIIWIGRNNFPFDITDPPNSAAATALKAMINFQTNGDKFVLLPVLNGSGEGKTGNPTKYAAVVAWERYLQENWPNQYLPIRRLLIDNGLSTLGITPTAQDNIDIADDTTPASLRADYIHQTGPAKGFVADRLAEFIISKGW